MITVADLRKYLADTEGELPHKLSGGLTFSDDELVDAMEAGARAYNSIPPFGVSTVTPNCMQSDTLLFFNACGGYALRRRVTLLEQQAVTESAGGVVSDVDATARAAMNARAEIMLNEFRAEARAFKGQRNMAFMFGHV